MMKLWLLTLTLALTLPGLIDIRAEPLNNYSVKQQIAVDFEIEGNTAFSDQELIDAMELQSLFRQSGKASSRNRPDAENIEEAIMRLRLFLGNHGYLTPNISKPNLENSSAGLKVKINVNEGTRFRFGEIKVEGSKTFEPEEILQLSGMRTGDIARVSTIREGIFEQVRKAYANRGYLQAATDLEQDLQPAPSGAEYGIANFTIRIDEGKPFVVRRVEFSGNTITRDRILRREILINEGDIYNQELLDKTLERLNRLGIFKKIKESDVSISTDEKKEIVDINIFVKEKNKQTTKTQRTQRKD